jgi:hypothetical protein
MCFVTKAKSTAATSTLRACPVVSLRYEGMIHDFGLLNALSQVPGTRAALHQASEELKMRLK